MDVLDPTRGQLDHLDRVGPRDHEVGDVQADTSLGAHQQPFDLLRPLNDAAKPGLHGELEPVPRAHVLDRADQVEQVRPLRVGKQSLVCTHRMAFGYGREDQRFGADRREPVRMPVDVRQLRSTDAVVMEDRVDLPGDDVETMPPQHCLGVVAAVRQKPRRTGRDRAFADGRGLAQHALGVDLVSPVAGLVDAPARRREREPVHRPDSPGTDATHPAH